MKLDLESSEIANIQVCLARVMKLPEVDLQGMKSLMILHEKIETQRKSDDNPN